MASSASSSQNDCGLCGLSTIRSKTEKNKRKLLHGGRCNEELEILRKEIERHETLPSLSRIKELTDPLVYLCNQCQNLLKSKKHLESKLKSKIEEIDCKLGFLMERSCVRNRKRPLEEDDSETRPDKVIVEVSNKDGTKRTTLTPCRTEVVKSISKRNYRSAATNFVSGVKQRRHLINALANCIRTEMKKICSLNYNSMLRQGHRGITKFSWECVWQELVHGVPTLIGFFQRLFPKAPKKFISFLACAILKKRCKHMSLMQHVFSFLLFANATNKEVYRFLQPFMVCMAPSTTNKVVEGLINGFDGDVITWSNQILKDTRFTPMTAECNSYLIAGSNMLADNVDETDSDSDWSDCESVYSVGDMSAISDAEEEDDSDTNVDDFAMHLIEEMVEVEVADIVDEELSLIVSEIFDNPQSSISAACHTSSSASQLSMDISLTSCPSTQFTVCPPNTRSLPNSPVCPPVTLSPVRPLGTLSPVCPPVTLSPVCPTVTLSPVCSTVTLSPVCPPNTQSTVTLPDINTQQSMEVSVPANLIHNAPPVCPGYTLVIDNIDMNVRRSYQRLDRTTKSYHFCHGYAVLNRVSSTLLPDGPQLRALSPQLILPNQTDLEVVLSDFVVLVSRVLVRYMPRYNSYKTTVQWHIPSEYTQQMSQKSHVVPLGIQPKNEAELKQMAEILDELNLYVPMCHYSTVREDGEMDYRVAPIPRLLFGDQLTVARVRGAAVLRSSHIFEPSQLGGFVPTVSDWHARLCLVTVMVDRQYSTKSACDKGTLYQLKQVVNRTSFGKEPKHNMKATEDFMEVVLYSHILAAASECSGGCGMSCEEVAKWIVSTFVKMTIPSFNDVDEAATTVPQPASSNTHTAGHNTSTGTRRNTSTGTRRNTSTGRGNTRRNTSTGGSNTSASDSVNSYAIDFLSMGLFWHAFHDAIREGDGNRILCYWKFMAAIFRQEKHYNYANEGVNLLTQTLLLSPRQVCEIKWGRTVNTTGRIGRNIPVDLHMEHLNRRLKIMMRNLGSNITPKTVQRSAKTLGPIEQACAKFREEIDVAQSKSYHTVPANTKDVSKLTEQLVTEEVFKFKEKRQHKTFKDHKPLLQSIDWDKIIAWVEDRVSNNPM